MKLNSMWRLDIATVKGLRLLSICLTIKYVNTVNIIKGYPFATILSKYKKFQDDTVTTKKNRNHI